MGSSLISVDNLCVNEPLALVHSPHLDDFENWTWNSLGWVHWSKLWHWVVIDSGM